MNYKKIERSMDTKAFTMLCLIVGNALLVGATEDTKEFVLYLGIQATSVFIAIFASKFLSDDYLRTTLSSVYNAKGKDDLELRESIIKINRMFFFLLTVGILNPILLMLVRTVHRNVAMGLDLLLIPISIVIYFMYLDEVRECLNVKTVSTVPSETSTEETIKEYHEDINRIVENSISIPSIQKVAVAMSNQIDRTMLIVSEDERTKVRKCVALLLESQGPSIKNSSELLMTKEGIVLASEEGKDVKILNVFNPILSEIKVLIDVALATERTRLTLTAKSGITKALAALDEELMMLNCREESIDGNKEKERFIMSSSRIFQASYLYVNRHATTLEERESVIAIDSSLKETEDILAMKLCSDLIDDSKETLDYIVGLLAYKSSDETISRDIVSYFILFRETIDEINSKVNNDRERINKERRERKAKNIYDFI